MNNDSKSAIKGSSFFPPSFAVLLLAWILPKYILDAILGDLIEEFNEKAIVSNKAANKWFWQQAIHTCIIYFKKKFNSPDFIRKLNVALPCMLFLMAFLLINWLSSVDSLAEYAPGFWQTLLTGQAHMALFEGAFWSNLGSYIAQIDDISFLVDIPSLIITFFSLSLLVYLDKKLSLSPLKMACWGYTLVILPYIWSIVHINSNHFIATQIGPIIAIGLITFLYMVLPVSYLVHRKLKQMEIDTRAKLKQGYDE